MSGLSKRYRNGAASIKAFFTVLPVAHETLGLSPLQVGILLSANRWVRIGTNHLARSVLERRTVPPQSPVPRNGAGARIHRKRNVWYRACSALWRYHE